MPFDNTPTEITVDTPASLLIEAGIKLIEQPKHWCRGVPMTFLLGGGTAYCAWGAVRDAGNRKWADGFAKAYEALGMEAVARDFANGFANACEALNAVAKRYHYRNIADLNDDATTTHAMVLEVMREAAEIARGEP